MRPIETDPKYIAGRLRQGRRNRGIVNRREDKRQSVMIKRRFSSDQKRRWMRILLGLPCYVGNKRFEAVSEACIFYTGKAGNGNLFRALHEQRATWRGLPVAWAEEALEKLAHYEAQRKKLPPKRGTRCRIDDQEFISGAAAARHFDAGRAATRKLGEVLARGGGTWKGMRVVRIQDD